MPGEFYLRELPPLRAVLEDLSGLGLLVVDGYADLDPSGRPGLGARAHAEFGLPVIGVAKSRFRSRNSTCCSEPLQRLAPPTVAAFWSNMCLPAKHGLVKRSAAEKAPPLSAWKWPDVALMWYLAAMIMADSGSRCPEVVSGGSPSGSLRFR